MGTRAVAVTESEVRAILAHGPWPTPVASDPANRASGRRAAVELGEPVSTLSNPWRPEDHGRCQ